MSSASVAADEDLTIIVSVGNIPAALLALDLTAKATEIDFAVYRTPTYTGGSSLPLLNLNDIVGITGQENVDMINSTVNVTDKGTAIFGPWNLFSENNSTITRNIGGPLVLKPNTEYLIAIHNPSGSPVEMSLAVRYVDH